MNGDDFGYTRGVNAGILQAFREGILTSTTIMAGGEAFEDAATLARSNPDLGVGCHLVLVGGRAVACPPEVPSLVDAEGQLPRSLAQLWLKLSLRAVRQADLERELRAQIERVRSAGIQPTHLDTHKHTHLHPRVMEALARVAGEFGIRFVRKPFESLRSLIGLPAAQRTRPLFLKQSVAAAATRAGEPWFRRLARTYGMKTPDYFFGIGVTGLLGRRALLAVLNNLPDGATGELMCHPGLYDEELQRSPTRLKRQRQQELEALTDPAVLRAVEEHSIRLISYRELANANV